VASLTALLDNSLLRQEEHAGQARFSMLETLSEYARERLEESGEAEELRQRYAAS
jgi:predicted ATPase